MSHKKLNSEEMVKLHEIEQFIDSVKCDSALPVDTQENAEETLEVLDRDFAAYASLIRVLRYKLLKASGQEEVDEHQLTALDWTRIHGFSPGVIKTRLRKKLQVDKLPKFFASRILFEATEDLFFLPKAEKNDCIMIDGKKYTFQSPALSGARRGRSISRTKPTK